jgi:hypothetical protein
MYDIIITMGMKMENRLKNIEEKLDKILKYVDGTNALDAYMLETKLRLGQLEFKEDFDKMNEEEFQKKYGVSKNNTNYKQNS